MSNKKIAVILGIFALLALSAYFAISYRGYSTLIAKENFNKDKEVPIQVPDLLHIPKPQYVKAVYMSSWVAGTTEFRNEVTKLIEETEINSIVIDFKDSSGVVATPAQEGASNARREAASRRAPNLSEYIKELHSKNIYVIARIAVFEDPVYSQSHSGLSVQTDQGGIWQDRHGLSWVDPGSLEFHKYIRELALEAHSIGFDEINFDYVRFPTDGSSDKVFPISQSIDPDVIKNFLVAMHSDLSSKGILMSIDVFGQIVSTSDDMGIGQYYEDLLLATDTISPMVYPSHFYPGYKNLRSPEEMPYETIKLSLSDAIKRREAISSKTEIRPWLQDFSLAVPYGKESVKAQIKAAEELGIHSYMLWSPRNKYTKEALKLE